LHHFHRNAAGQQHDAVGGLYFSRSTDGGKTFKSLQNGIAHSDHHAAWIDPNNGNHLWIGNDGGLDVSYDQGDTWEFVNTIPAAQFYAIGVDMRKPYNVYGGLQDNGSWGGPSQTRSGQAGITNADWYRVGGGDGFYAQADPTDYNTVYSESQGGAMNRLDLRTGRSVSIRPRGTPQRRGGRGGGGGGGGAAPSASPAASPGASPEATPDQLAAFAAARALVVSVAKTRVPTWFRRRRRRAVSLLLEHANCVVSTQPARHLHRWRSVLQVVGSW
jgi:hypothetical protein